MIEGNNSVSHQGLKAILESYLRENEAVFLKHACSPALPESMLGIHQMRVATKRLRSLYRLMAWLAPDLFNPKTELKAVRRFFKAAGEVRDLQMRNQIFEGHCLKLGLDFPRYTSYLRALRVKAQKELRKRMPRFSADMLTRPNAFLLGLLSHMSEEEVLQSAIQLVKQREADMLLLLPPKYDPERLHQIRIQLKENLYVMTQVNAAVEPPIWPDERLEMVKKAAETAGDWHDLEVFVASLEQLHVGQARLFPNERHFELLMGALKEDLKHELRRYQRQLKKLLGDADAVTEGRA